MKSKEWYREFEHCSSEEEFDNKFEECLTSLSEETISMIKKRNCKTDDAIAGCIKDTNQKWKAIISIHDKKKNDDNYHLPDFMYEIELLDDAFKAAFTHLYPKYGKLFDLEKHKKYVDHLNKVSEERRLKMKNFFFHKVIPFEELTMDNLTSEIINCSVALRSYINAGFLPEWVKPLACRIKLLKYWKEKGSIDLNDVNNYKIMVNSVYGAPKTSEKESG